MPGTGCTYLSDCYIKLYVTAPSTPGTHYVLRLKQVSSGRVLESLREGARERDVTSALDVQLLAQEVLRSDSSLLPGILGYISGRSLGLEANGVDRGLYPPST